MVRTWLVTAAAVFLSALPTLSQQQYVTIAYESFDYPAGPMGDMNGGIGWMSSWWCGPQKDDGEVLVPGFDPVGGKARTAKEHQGSWRLLETAGMEPILDNGLFGKDDTTIWVSFQCQRTTGGDDEYGGLILNWQWNGEQCFFGSPFSFFEWGFEQPWISPPQFIQGTSSDFKAHLVARIDFLPGDEYVQMWVDPGTLYPTSPPDLFAFMSDFRFNEIALKSGHGLTTGYEFDDVLISTPTFRPVYSITNLVAGQTATADVTNCDPGNTVILAYSLAGPGPTNTPLGAVDMSPPIIQYPPQIADPSGNVSVNVPVPGFAAGMMVYSQAAELFAGGGGELSNSLALQVQ